MVSTKWLVRQAGVSRPVRLYCFPYSGGNASAYLPWNDEIGDDIEVCGIQLPGRGARYGEPPITSMTELVPILARVIMEQRHPNFAFFGHSLGGLLAYEVARYCLQHYGQSPSHLFISGCTAPHHRTEKWLHKMNDEELIAQLRQFNGTPPEILANSELMALVLPVMRADSALSSSHVPVEHPPLYVPVSVLAGEDDAHVPLDHAQAWQRYTSSRFSMHRFEGDHFFIHPQRLAVLDVINSQLRMRCFT